MKLYAAKLLRANYGFGANWHLNSSQDLMGKLLIEIIFCHRLFSLKVLNH